MGNRLSPAVRPDGMWKLVFFERKGLRVVTDRSGPWLPGRDVALSWAQFFQREGHNVALLAQDGTLEKLGPSLPA